MTLTMLPTGSHLLYRDYANGDAHTEYLQEFTEDDVGNMNMEALGYMYAVEEFSDRWEEFLDIDVQHNTESEESAEYVPIEVLWDGRNWQDMLDSDIQSISNTEPRLLGTKC
ncbi:MAG: hypothetical protein ACKPKO_14200, partial [Candidatus Fonsibacter sp.]